MVGHGKRLRIILLEELFEQIKILYGDQAQIDGATFDYWYDQDIEVIQTTIQDNYSQMESKGIITGSAGMKI